MHQLFLFTNKIYSHEFFHLCFAPDGSWAPDESFAPDTPLGKFVTFGRVCPVGEVCCFR